MKITPKHTSIVMWALLISAGVYEIFSVVFGTAATESEWVWRMIQTPIFTLACGVLVGHFFWQRDTCVNCGKNPIRKEP